MTKISIILLYLITSISILEAVNAGEDRTITLGNYATLNATELAGDATVTWSILDDIYSNERVFYFSPSSIGTYNIHLVSSDGTDDYVNIQVTSDGEDDSNQSNNGDSNATIDGATDILVGETATFSTTYQSDTQLSWKLNGDTYAYGDIFYFTPSQSAIYNLTLNDGNGELTSKTINVTEEATPPPEESNCTAKTTDDTCLQLTQEASKLLPDYPSCYRHELLLKHGDNPTVTAGVSVDLTFRPHEPCDRQPITNEEIIPLQDGSYLVSWLAGYLYSKKMYLKKFNTNGEESYYKEKFIPMDNPKYQIKSLKNGNFVVAYSKTSSLPVKIYNSNIELLSYHSISTTESEGFIIDTESYNDGSFDIKYKIRLYPDVWETRHFSGN